MPDTRSATKSGTAPPSIPLAIETKRSQKSKTPIMTGKGKQIASTSECPPRAAQDSDHEVEDITQENQEEQEEEEEDNADNLKFLRSLATTMTKAVAEGLKKQVAPAIKYRTPDTYNGSNLEKLRTFLSQCNVYFRAKPNAFIRDYNKVMFAVSYLHDSALQWFQLGLDSKTDSDWLDDWSEFKSELLGNFGIYNESEDAAIKLELFIMAHDTCISDYTVKFNKYSAQVDWTSASLCCQYYKGLSNRLKDFITLAGKLTVLPAMKRLAAVGDQRHWERQGELQRDKTARASASGFSSHPRPTQNNFANFTSASTSGNTSSPSNSNRQDRKEKHRGKDWKPSFPPASSFSGSSASTSTSTNFLSGKLGKDGKLTTKERQRRMDNKLCMFCAKPGHIVKNCCKATSSAAKARQASASDPDPALKKSDSEKA